MEKPSDRNALTIEQDMHYAEFAEDEVRRLLTL